MSSQAGPARKPSRLLVALPLLVFAALAGIFLLQLFSGRDISKVPSALIGEPAPKTVLPPLMPELPGMDTGTFAGKVTLVNVWGSWCGPCREEHPVMMALGEDARFDLVGFNYKDKPDNARRFLSDLGNPYAAIGTDEAGRSAIDWGVYGAPETFVIGKDGTIRYKFVGPLSPDTAATVLMPEVEKALAE